MFHTAAFFGHRDVFENIDNDIYYTVSMLVEKGVKTFLVGEQGEFDRKCSSAVQKIKKNHSDVKLILVCPYFSNKINFDSQYYKEMFDDIIIPDEIADVHYKAAIGARNRWMIDHSDYIVSYIRRNYGGAYTALKYAEKKSKLIIHI